MAKSEFGARLKAVFNDAVNAEIAEKMGVSEDAVGTYVRGRVPNAEKLLLINQLTNCNLHWLLTGKGRQFGAHARLDNELNQFLRSIAEEQAPNVYDDSNIAGKIVDDEVFELLTTYLIVRSLASLRLIADESDLMSATELGRARKMSFVASGPQTIEDRMRDLIRSEIAAQIPVHDLGEIDGPFDVRAAVERYDNPALVMRDWFAHDQLPDMPHVIMPSGWESMTLDEKVSEIRGLRAIIDRQKERKKYAPSIRKAS